MCRVEPDVAVAGGATGEGGMSASADFRQAQTAPRWDAPLSLVTALTRRIGSQRSGI